jgi:hypothetical protein
MLKPELFELTQEQKEKEIERLKKLKNKLK